MDIIYADWDFETVNWGYILISFTVKTLKLEKKKKKFIMVGDWARLAYQPGWICGHHIIWKCFYKNTTTLQHTSNVIQTITTDVVHW